MRSAGRCSGRGPRTQSPPRPRRPRRSKKSADVVAAEAAAHPDVPVEVVCADAHRLGPKPVLRSVWAPKGERPVGLGHHRFTWRYVMAVVAPASGETVWPLSNGVSKALFAGLLDAFAREVGAGPGKRVVVLLDNAGFHTRPNLVVPDGIRLVYLPPYSPELQRAETLWPMVDEPIVNRLVPDFDHLTDTIAERCRYLTMGRLSSARAQTSPGGLKPMPRSHLADVELHSHRTTR